MLTQPISQSEKVDAEQAIVIDAYAWVEYAVDGPHAGDVNNCLNKPIDALTPATVVGELKDSMLRHRISSVQISSIIAYIRSRSSIVNINADLAERAGEINFNRKRIVRGWGMLDSFVYAVAATRKTKIITGDPHFKDLPNVIYIGE